MDCQTYAQRSSLCVFLSLPHHTTLDRDHVGDWKHETSRYEYKNETEIDTLPLDAGPSRETLFFLGK